MSAVAFSVIIPLFNKREFVRQTLLSVLVQDHPDFEVIIVDDGSTDGGTESVRDLVGDKLRVVRQDNAGPGPARNRGVAVARFPWIAFLDADDFWLPWHLSTLAGLIERFPTVDAVASGFTRVARVDAEALPERRPGEGQSIDYFDVAIRREVLFTSCTAVRRDTFLELGGFRSFYPGEDMELWARLALGHEIATTPTISALYVIGTGGLMDQSGSAHASVERQPVFRTLDQALGEPRYADKHASIRRYRVALLKLFARQALFNRNTELARGCLREVPVTAAPVLHLLSRLPAGVTGFGVWLKRRRGQPAA